jgi:hypothetical protein
MQEEVHINTYSDVCQAILHYVTTDNLLYNCRFVCKKWREILSEKSSFWKARFFHLYELRNDRRVSDDVYLKVISQ